MHCSLDLTDLSPTPKQIKLSLKMSTLLNIAVQLTHFWQIFLDR
jgi:hypothetical protein